MTGTWRGSRGWTPADDACRGARRKTEEEESEGLTGGPGEEISFSFLFFSRAVTVAVEVGTIISASCYCVVQLNWSDVPIRVVREFILFPGIEHKLHASIPLFYYDGSTVTTFKQQFLKDLAYIKFALKMD